MSAAANLAWLFWQRGGARQRAALTFTAAGVMASTVLALLVLSVAPALDARSDRIAWRTPTEAVANPDARAFVRSTTDSFAGRTIQRVDVAATGAGPLPAPPGLQRVPAAGEVFLSPALARLISDEPSGVLAARFGDQLTGTIGAAGLAHTDELAAVVGQAPDDLRPTVDPSDESFGTPWWGDVVPVADLTSGSSDPGLALYRVLAQMAAVLLVVPTLILIGAAARLTATQRAERLAALRLAGAMPATVVGLTAIEMAAAALVGTVAGVAGYLAALPLAARIPLAGGTFWPADLRFGWLTLAATLVVVPLAAAGSATVALRRVVISPLGVSRRERPRRPRVVRLAAIPAAWALLGGAVGAMQDNGSSTGVLVGLAAVIATLTVVGPWLAWLIGRLLTASARSPAPLVAGRRILDDPKGAFRTVSGMVLAGLIAGFLLGVIPTVSRESVADPDDASILVTAATERAPAIAATVRAADPGAVIVGDDGGDGAVNLTVIATSTHALEKVKTTVVRAAVDAYVWSLNDGRDTQQVFLDDLGRASVIMALASLAMATTAAGISGAASIFDQRLTLARLRLIGTPLAVLQRARRWQTLVPLTAASAGALLAGVAAGLVMLRAFNIDIEPFDAATVGSMAALVAAAVAAGLVVVALTRPLLVAASGTTPARVGDRGAGRVRGARARRGPACP